MVDALIPYLGKLSLRARPCVPTKMFQSSSLSSPNANPPPPVDFGPGVPGDIEIDEDDSYTKETRNGKITYLMNGDVMKQWDPMKNTMSFYLEGKLTIKCTLDWINNQWTPALYEFYGAETDPNKKSVQVYDVNTGVLLVEMDSVPGENWVWRYSPKEKKTFLYKDVVEKRTTKTVKFEASDLDNPLQKTWISGNKKETIHTIKYHPGTKRKYREERETPASIMTDLYKHDSTHNKDYITHSSKFDRKMNKQMEWIEKEVINWFDDNPNKAPEYR